jgi:hypothetical protein
MQNMKSMDFLSKKPFCNYKHNIWEYNMDVNNLSSWNDGVNPEGDGPMV